MFVVDIQPGAMGAEHLHGPLLGRWLAGSLNGQRLCGVLHCPSAAGDHPWGLEGSGAHVGSGARHPLQTDLAARRPGGRLFPGAHAGKPTTLFMARGVPGDMITLATYAA